MYIYFPYLPLHKLARGGLLEEVNISSPKKSIAS